MAMNKLIKIILYIVPTKRSKTKGMLAKKSGAALIKCSGTEVIFLQILLLMENYDKRNFILIEPMSRFSFQLLLTDTAAAEKRNA